MIPEEYVTFESAKLLKEAGFPQDENVVYKRDRELDVRGYVDDDRIVAAAPTQAQAMRWLREDMGLIVTPRYDWDIGWYYTFENPKYEVFKVCDYGRNNAFPTYETAAEAGIQAACVYLIEKGGEE